MSTTAVAGSLAARLRVTVGPELDPEVIEEAEVGPEVIEEPEPVVVSDVLPQATSKGIHTRVMRFTLTRTTYGPGSTIASSLEPLRIETGSYRRWGRGYEPLFEPRTNDCS